MPRIYFRVRFVACRIADAQRMSHGGIVQPDEEIQHESFPAVSLASRLHVHALRARMRLSRASVYVERRATHLTLECMRRAPV